jgi:nucleotide-binding universal stress UspA family protein
MFTHLIVPLDGSPLAESVLPAAVAVATRLQAHVTLLHVIERAAPAKVHGERHLTQKADADTYLAEVAVRLSSAGIDSNAEVVQVDGDVANTIAARASQLGADLVVLCTHGRRGVRGFLYGRVAQQVLSHLAVPVLLLPPAKDTAKPTDFEIHRVLLPLEWTHQADETIAAACAIASAFSAEVLLITVVPTVNTMSGSRGAALRLLPNTAAAVLDDEVGRAQDYLSNVREKLATAGVRSEAMVERGEPFRILADTSARRDVDAIVMATHGRAGVSVVWSGSIAARILERTPLPILLIRVPADET